MKNRDKEGAKIRCRKCGEPFVVQIEEAKEKKRKASRPASTKEFAELPAKVIGANAVTKKQSAAEESEASANKPFIIVGGIVFFIAAWTGIIYGLSLLDVKTETGPTEVQQVDLPLKFGTSEQKNFAVQYPSEWSFETGGGTGGSPEWIRVQGDDISVNIRTNLRASALGDITSGGGTIQDEEMPEELEPIAQVHEMMKADLVSEMESYEEEAPEKVEARAGNSRISRFIGNRGFVGGGMAYGFRATVPRGNDKLKVTAVCESEKVFEAHEQLLRKIILSIGSPPS
ncbi:hypothetical protein [Rubinisphaera margarita]|uniref:hypothetical protein n=1 Tax=Rubinisphaera margarita TaxID=2909586 RepID=UPI001EE7E6C6|nr:hypothetical protein [Rubinisphaera margarita]MCG6155133.1 hypothetical protein [Rubinisphaera margarita]